MTTEKALSIIPDTRRLLQERMAASALLDFDTYRTSVLQDGSIEDLRKLVDMEMKTAGIIADTKVDAFAHLPVFNFVFHAPGQPTLVPPDQAPPLEIIEDVAPRDVTPPPPPEPVRIDDLLGMMVDLEDSQP